MKSVLCWHTGVVTEHYIFDKIKLEKCLIYRQIS